MILLCTDEDCIEAEPQIEQVWPRDRKWERHHLEAIKEIERRLRSTHSTADRFEMGRVSLRSQDALRPTATHFSLHFMFVAADTLADDTGFYARKAAYHWKRAEALFDAERTALDYDIDRSGTVDAAEESQPMPPLFIRG